MLLHWQMRGRRMILAEPASYSAKTMFQVHSRFKLCSRTMCYACKHYIHNILLLLPYPLAVSMYIRQESIQGRYLRVSNGNDCCCGCEMLRNVQHMLPALLLSNTH